MKRLAPDTDAAVVAESLHRLGYACVEGVLDRSSVDIARAELGALLDDAPLGTHEYVGFRTRRVGRLFARTRCLDRAAVHPLVQDVLDTVIGHHQLTAPTVIELLPGEVAGPWHHDDCFYPLRRPHPALVVNTLWAIDDFTDDNGATELLARSHEWPDTRSPRDERPVKAVMPAGSVLFFLGSVWHRNGANATARGRIGVSLEFVCSWLRPQETLTLSVPPRVVAELDPRLQDLLGYTLSPSGLGHVGGEDPRASLPRLVVEWS